MRWIDARTEDPFAQLARRTAESDAETRRVVSELVEDVRRRGDEALLEAARSFDAPKLESIWVTEEEIRSARVSEEEERALAEAAKRILLFHWGQMAKLQEGWSSAVWWSDEGEVGQRMLPVDSAGIYVPGGRAAYPSSVLMNALPAVAAGVRRIVVATPARPDGSIAPAVLVALRLAGVREAIKVGGASAIAALALGTQTLRRVDVVAGPGNRFVNEAKRQLWGQVGLDGFAGPSEVCVLTDETTNPTFAAADLLTQIEHAPDNVGYLVGTSERTLRAILGEVERQTASAERRSTLEAALQGSLAFLASDDRQAADIVNAIAPEHLSVATAEPERWLGSIRNAGCVLLGEWSPESAGDFVAGPSHTLPTGGSARFQSPVSALTFLKLQSLIRLERATLEGLAPTIAAFGRMEGFPAHARGATIRFEDPA
ncbi:MAG: histidinol dehydrogenase [Fimbriimonadales bacterium]|nr:histidinol dehydrogenase [Fimbriimonadales bacterium]